MNEATTITKTTSYNLDGIGFNAGVGLSDSVPTLKEVEAITNKALTECVKNGKTPIGVSLEKICEYLCLVVYVVDADAPLEVKESFSERINHINLKQEAWEA